MSNQFAPYFVMLNTQNGSCSPMTEDNGDVAFYADIEDAVRDAEDNVLGNQFGFEVFQRGCGEVLPGA